MLYNYLCAEMKKDKVLNCTAHIDKFTISIDIASKIATILDINILLKLISDRIGSRKMWMPRIAGA